MSKLKPNIVNDENKIESDKNIYNSKYISALFDNMSTSYKRVNYITSFGFSEQWRKQCVNNIEIKRGQVVADLLTGMGECWPLVLKKTGTKGKLIALDFSAGMLHHALRRKNKLKAFNIDILKEDVFKNSIISSSVDIVISGFGMKTFSKEQFILFADEMKRILKPGGQFSLVDVSVPNWKLLKIVYLFYLKHIIPILGKLFLGNPETYRMLGVYTENFGNARELAAIFKTQGFEVEFVEYFFGCATGIKGRLIK